MKVRMILAMAAAACGVVILYAQQRPAGPYTQDQAVAGNAIYQTNCASCHSGDLSGREGPQLAGASFLAQWGNRTAGELISFMQSTMPPGGVALPGDSYLNLAAFILDANGARAGVQALATASPTSGGVTIRSVASGQRAAYLQTGGGPAASQVNNAQAKQGKQGKRFLPPKIAGFGRDCFGNSFLHHIEFGPESRWSKGYRCLHRSRQVRVIESARVLNALMRHQLEIFPAE